MVEVEHHRVVLGRLKRGQLQVIGDLEVRVRQRLGPRGQLVCRYEVPARGGNDLAGGQSGAVVWAGAMAA